MEFELTKYLHTMIRVTDPEATVAFFKLIGVEETRRFDNEAGRFTLIFLAAPGQEGPPARLFGAPSSERLRQFLSSTGTETGTRSPVPAPRRLQDT